MILNCGEHARPPRVDGVNRRDGGAPAASFQLSRNKAIEPRMKHGRNTDVGQARPRREGSVECVVWQAVGSTESRPMQPSLSVFNPCFIRG